MFEFGNIHSSTFGGDDEHSLPTPDDSASLYADLQIELAARRKYAAEVAAQHDPFSDSDGDNEASAWAKLAVREAEVPVIPPAAFARMNALVVAAFEAEEQARAALARKALAVPEQEPDAQIERQPQPVYASWWLTVLLLIAICVVVLVAALATATGIAR